MGGNVYADTTPIPNDIASRTASYIRQSLLSRHVTDIVGSVVGGKSHCGDIDILVLVPHGAVVQFVSHTSTALAPFSPKYNRGFQQLHLRFPISRVPGCSANINMIAQVDLILCSNIDYAKFMMGGSKERNMLLMAFVGYTSEFLIDDFRQKLNLSLARGLWHITQQGRRVVNRILVNECIDDIMRIIGIRRPGSFESLFQEIAGHPDRDRIFEKTIEMMRSAKITIPKEMEPWQT